MNHLKILSEHCYWNECVVFDKEKQLVLLELPSDNKKTFSFFSFVLLDKISLSLHSRCANTKAGY
jgi:hypothetical protein